MGHFGDGIGNAFKTVVVIAILAVILAGTLGVFWVFDIRPGGWMLYTVAGAVGGAILTSFFQKLKD